MSKTKRNIRFEPGVVKYNALKRFKDGIVKIPSYVLAEVMKNDIRLEIYYRDKFLISYKSNELYKHIKKTEDKTYKGKFRYKDITYKLSQLET